MSQTSEFAPKPPYTVQRRGESVHINRINELSIGDTLLVNGKKWTVVNIHVSPGLPVPVITWE
jgi:hypothetical protein